LATAAKATAVKAAGAALSLAVGYCWVPTLCKQMGSTPMLPGTGAQQTEAAIPVIFVYELATWMTLTLWQ